ncbi:hypothetical protein DSO57_1035991 [Entomophthora muscae]|uniref:Uncharacterized protein n=1 Tax=Entomophthora muscae TaxID=34485 RepID=A0ACC2TYU3_9FUNG|nr:hypothetical protein DSO57_1035991 [Entomophthora muscae]
MAEEYAYGTVKSHPSRRVGESLLGHELNLVNKVTTRSASDIPMTLGREMYWAGNNEDFSNSHFAENHSSPRKIAYSSPGCLISSYSVNSSFYRWSEGMQVSNPVLCNINQTCTASAKWSIPARIRTTSSHPLHINPLALISHSDIVTPVALAVSAQSPRNFQLEFSGPDKKKLMFKSLYYTILIEMNCMGAYQRSTNFNTYNVAIQLPAVLPATGDGDGVFYLEDA